jgi:fructose-bisphosphate aldolase class I
VALATIKCLKATVPASVPGIAFLSGGQSAEVATDHLGAMNMMGSLPWQLTFSYGRALQAPSLKAWGGNPDGVKAGQAALLKRARLNGLAHAGKYQPDMEAA